MKFKTLAQFEAFLKTRIPTREALFMGDLGLKRAQHFLKLLGNPQNKLKVVHIAGTSGKGSTAHLTSHLLKSQGFKVGLSISPHIFDVRERMQIDNQLPSEKLVLKYFNQILPAILKMEKCKYGMPTFFEINVALAFFMFHHEKLDYAVMETGLGGTLDATNIVTTKNKLCLLTRIGLDHTEILGNTIAKIASEKAGIIQDKNMVISQKNSSRSSVISHRVIEARCKKRNSKLQTLEPGKNYTVLSSTPQETIFNFKFSPLQQNSTTASQCHNLQNIKLGLIGKHQAENCSLALACLLSLSERDKFKLRESKLRTALKNIRIPGRFEIKKFGKQTLLIDGAHNPQKMTTFTKNLTTIFPQQKFTFLIAFKKGKDFKPMLKKIIPLADKILLTQFSTSGMDNHWSSIDNQEISNFLNSPTGKPKFKKFSIVANKKTDILKAIRESKKPIAITGSLYLIGSIYSYLKK